MSRIKTHMILDIGVLRWNKGGISVGSCVDEVGKHYVRGPTSSSIKC